MEPNNNFTQPTPSVVQPIAPSISKQPIEPKTSFSKWTLFILLIVFAILISIIGYLLLGKSFNTQSQNSTSIIKTINKKPDINNTLQFTPLTASESANWKTYINNKYNFSIKYPNNYEFTEWSGVDNILNTYDLGYKFGQGDILWISVYKDNINKYVNNLKGDNNYYLVKYDYNKGKIVEYRSKPHDDNSIIKSDSVVFVSYFIQNNGFLFEVHIKGWHYPLKNNYINDSGIFHEMISSLNFRH